MNKKKLLIALPAAALISLSSCGGSTEELTINVWTGFGTSMTTAFEAILDTYQASHENINIVHTGQGGYDNLLSAIVGSVSTTTYPQLAVAYPDHMAQYYESNILFDLTNSIETLGIDLDDYYQNYLQENQEIAEGSTLGLPFNKSTEVMTTNQTFVDTLIELTKDKTGDNKITGVPTTWQDMETFGLAAINVLTEIGAFNKIIGTDYKVYADSLALASAGVDALIDLTSVGSDSFRVVSYDSQANFFITTVRQWGGTYTSVETLANGKKQGYMHYKSTETVEMLKFFNRLFRENIMGIPATFGESSYTSTPFKAYKTIFTIGSSAGVSNCVSLDDDGNELINVEINPVPYNKENPNAKYVISQGTNLVMFKNSNAENRTESLNLLKTLSYDPETNATFAKNSGYIPVTKSAYNSTIYQNYLNDTTLSGTAETMRDAVKLNFDVYQGGEGWTQFVDPGFVGSSSIRTNVAGIMGECKDTTESDASSDDYWNELLDKYYQYDSAYIPA